MNINLTLFGQTLAFAIFVWFCMKFVWPPITAAMNARQKKIAEGLDADLALVDPRSSWTIHAKDSPSTQGYTPFEGIELSAKVKATFLRGKLVCENGNVVGKPGGRYLHRPTS